MVGFLVVGLFAIGMALAFWSADPRSPTSRALALFLTVLGVTMLANIPASREAVEGVVSDAWVRFFSLAEIAIMLSGLEWGLRVARTSAVATPGLKIDGRVVRFAQGVAVLYGVMGFAFPGLRREVWNVVPTARLLLRPAYYLFALPFSLALILPIVRLARRMRVGVDPAERLRLISAAAAIPFWSTGFFVPFKWKPVGFALGEVIFLVGAVRYHVVQGQRGQFLARFLSPQLAGLVRERGLTTVLRQSRSEISVVACDLRGFTAFAETAAPEEVMKLLEEYYEAVGRVVSELGGSIKDFAGDGILALVGAPVACPDHARRAIAMALEIRDRGEAILLPWRKRGLDLGLGVGAASGFATVGTIGGSARLEYAAVGPVVNLASRLASRAEDGQVLAEPRIVGSVAEEDGFSFVKLAAAELKGFARPVTLHAVDRAAATRVPRG